MLKHGANNSWQPTPVGRRACIPESLARRGCTLRSPSMRAERAKLKSCKDDDIIAQGKRSAALGCGPKMISSFFPSGLARQGTRQTRRKKRGWVGWRVTQGGGLGGLALGYYQAAPPGLRRGEPAAGPSVIEGRSASSAPVPHRRLRLGFSFSGTRAL